MMKWHNTLRERSVKYGKKYDSFQHRLFEKTGCLLRTDGCGDHLVQPEGLSDYKIPPPTMLEPTPQFAVSSSSEGESKDDDDESLQYVGRDEEENYMLVE